MNIDTFENSMKRCLPSKKEYLDKINQLTNGGLSNANLEEAKLVAIEMVDSFVAKKNVPALIRDIKNIKSAKRLIEITYYSDLSGEGLGVIK